MNEPGPWIRTDRSRRAAVRASFRKHPFLVLQGLVLRRRGLSERYPTPTSRQDVLRRVADLPISTWTYGWEHETVKHLGPMAQDFARSFGLGDSDVCIHGVDSAGVALAAIQALHERVVALEAEVARLRTAAGEPSGRQPADGTDP